MIALTTRGMDIFFDKRCKRQDPPLTLHLGDVAQRRVLVAHSLWNVFPLTYAVEQGF